MKRALENRAGRRAGASGFTTVELLVATAVLALMVVLVVQMVNTAGNTTRQSGARIDADNEARAVFDRMSRDFSGMLNRSDVDCLFSKNAGNDAFYFQAEAAAYTGAIADAAARSPVALVGYRINPNTCQLERLGKALSWDGAPAADSAGGPIFLTFGNGTVPESASTIAGRWPGVVGGPPHTDGEDESYHVISAAVFRMEFAFLKFDAATSQYVPYVPSSQTALSGASGGLKDIAAVVVAIAILDEASQNPVRTDATSGLKKATADQMIAALEDVSTLAPGASTAEFMAAKWKASVESASFASNAGLPRAAASNVRIYQRTFYLNPVSR